MEKRNDYHFHAERFRVFLEDIADGYYETDLRGNFIFFNKALCRIFGYLPEEILHHNFREFMDETNARLAFENTHRIYVTGEGLTDIIWEIITKDKQKRILEASANLILDHEGRKIGFRGIVRDMTLMYQTQASLRESERIAREQYQAIKRAERTNQILFRIANALPQYQELDELLVFITSEVQDIIGVEGASVILLDEEKKEFFFRTVVYENRETGRKMKEIRFPVDKGVAGYVYRTGEPLIVSDTSESIYFYKKVDEKAGYETRNMLDVPIRTKDRMVGVLCCVNKKSGAFDRKDLELVSTIASTVAPTIEHARINEALKRSYEEVQSLNRAKERVIHHLSHELKTPISVLAASMELLKKKLSCMDDASINRILDRSDRNLHRLLEILYKTEDILREKDFKSYHMMNSLLEVSTDVIETFISEHHESQALLTAVRNRIDQLFGQKNWEPKRAEIDRFVETSIQRMYPLFSHRKCQIIPRILSTSPVLIPHEVLNIIVEGLIRNAIENTPDGGRIAITVRQTSEGPELEVNDFGVGITENNQRHIFESIFTTRDTQQYSTKKPFDFNAGGKGFDLFRMKLFSERYHFTITMDSTRCRFIPTDQDICPGNVDDCVHCHTIADCINSGGTRVVVQFPSYRG